jgi:hypothetical protein
MDTRQAMDQLELATTAHAVEAECVMHMRSLPQAPLRALEARCVALADQSDAYLRDLQS